MGHARYEEAAAMFTQVVSLAPDSFTGYYNIGARVRHSPPAGEICRRRSLYCRGR